MRRIHTSSQLIKKILKTNKIYEFTLIILKNNFRRLHKIITRPDSFNKRVSVLQFAKNITCSRTSHIFAVRSNGVRSSQQWSSLQVVVIFEITWVRCFDFYFNGQPNVFKCLRLRKFKRINWMVTCGKILQK